MSKPNPADLPGSMAILGLLVEQPNQTVSDVGQSLEKRFTRSRFHRSTAHNALPQMARPRDARPRVRCTHKESPHRNHNQDRYEVTRGGLEAFRAWMYAVPTEQPALREALYGRIELCRLEDLPQLIRIAREESTIATDLYSEAKTKLNRHIRRERDVARRDNPGPEDYLRMVREVLLHVTPEYWAARSNHNDEIARHLEEIATKAGLPFEVRE